MKRTKIVCTIGPASEEASCLKALIHEGMNVARLNFSHGTHEEQKRKLDTLHRVREELHVPLAVALDTKGPEIRLGTFQNDEPVELARGGSLYVNHARSGGNRRNRTHFVCRTAKRCAGRNPYSHR